MALPRFYTDWVLVSSARSLNMVKASSTEAGD